MRTQRKPEEEGPSMKNVQKNVTRPAKDAAEAEAATGADVRNSALTEEVACCLEEIDSALAEQDEEREKAEEEFHVTQEKVGAGKLSRLEAEDILRVWEAKYAHLGLTVGWCCGSPEIYEKDE
jgi:hypothetical protein